jgi:hypothetical protein
MPQVIFDPDAARSFGSFLVNTVDGIESAQRNITSKFQELGECWKDEKYQRFSRIFEETMRNLQVFRKDANDYLDYLWRKEKSIREYLENRY